MAVQDPCSCPNAALLTTIKDLRRTNTGCDTYFEGVGGTHVSFHKIFLLANTANPHTLSMDERLKYRRGFSFPSVSFETLQAIAGYLYGEEMTINKQNIDEIKLVAETLELTYLKLVTDDFSLKFLSADAAEDLLSTEYISQPEIKEDLSISSDIPTIELLSSTPKYKRRATKGSDFQNKPKRIRHRVPGPANKLCKVCGKGFTKWNLVRIHERIHTDTRPYQCQICSKAFRQSCALKTHLLLHTNQRPYECPQCGKKFTTSTNLKVHHQRRHVPKEQREKFKCTQCSAAFENNTSLKYHMRTHTGEKPCICSICGEGFTNPSDRSRHKATHSKPPKVPREKVEKGTRNHICVICGKYLLTPSHLKRHEKTHGITHGEGDVQQETISYTCIVCDEAIVSFEDLDKHRSRHKGENAQERQSTMTYKCTLCTKVFQTSYSLRRHRRAHQSLTVAKKPVVAARKFECPVCKKFLVSSKSLARHIECSHIKDENVPSSVLTLVEDPQCEFCGNRFSKKSTLDSHIKRFHPTEKPPSQDSSTVDSSNA